MESPSLKRFDKERVLESVLFLSQVRSEEEARLRARAGAGGE